jgi:hypothetical protein
LQNGRDHLVVSFPHVAKSGTEHYLLEDTAVTHCTAEVAAALGTAQEGAEEIVGKDSILAVEGSRARESLHVSRNLKMGNCGKRKECEGLEGSHHSVDRKAGHDDTCRRRGP